MEIEREFNMEYGAFTSNSTTYGNFSENNMISNTEMGFMDELLIEGCWLETTGLGLNLFHPGPLPASAIAFNHEYPSHHYLPPLETNCVSHLSINQYRQQIYQEESTEGTFPESKGIDLVEGTELGMIRRWWIGPSWANPGPCSSVKERLMMAVGYLTECTKNMNHVLIQIWVPKRRSSEDRYFLTTDQDQPYSFGANCKSLANYRDVSRAYREFAVEEDIEVFWEKLPEWTPDIVRFFKRDEYPDIINYAHDHEQYYCGVRGFLALPVFERGSGTCLGVVEIVTSTADQKINVHRPELLENVCQLALDDQAYNYDELYQVALAEIVEVLATVCKTHRLPLALTWAPCLQQAGKGGCRRSDENYADCLSTVDTACFVSDAEVLGFHEACSEYHLFRGQGTVGTAFTTTKPCFATDMTAFSKTEYPLSHHARMFGLRAAVAIPFRSLYTGSGADFVLEFFLPKDCHDTQEQEQMLNSLSIVLQQACRSLNAVTEKVLDEEEIVYSVEEVVIASDHVRIKKEEPQKSVSSPLKEACSKESSRVAHMTEVQQKDKGISISLEYQEEDPKEEFKVTTHWDNTQGASVLNGQSLSEFGQLQQSSGSKDSVDGGGGSYSYGGRRSSSGRKTGEKRRTKTQKTISLSVLRQYFAGSLKDAAKSIGVGPTSLKKICRQHGITRWPSRKIKKVGHSLRKLQSVIDSVQGAEGAMQIGSFYTNFPELNSPGNGSFLSMKIIDNSNQSNPISESGLLNHGSSTHSKSLPSSCSQTIGPSSFCAGTGAQQHSTPINALSNAETLMREKPCGLLPMACSDADLHTLNRHEQNLLPLAECLKSFGGLPDLETLPILPDSSSHNSRDGSTGAFRVKVTFGDEKILFRFQPNWTFGDLQLEIARRLNLDDISRVDLRYLDDDREHWVLLACDADLQECIHIFRASQSHTLRLSLQHASNPYLGSPFGSSDLS